MSDVRSLLQALKFEEARAECHRILDDVAAKAVTLSREYAPKRKIDGVGKFLYLPIEVAQRDLPHRAKLAGDAARSGFQVLIGASWNLMAMHFNGLPPGIVLFKSMNALDTSAISAANRNGHLTAVMSEELFSLSPVAWMYDVDCDTQAMERLDLVCAHGVASAQALRELYPTANIQITGTPRAWLSVANARYCDDVVVCSMAGTINGTSPFEQYLYMIHRTVGRPIQGNFYRRLKEQIDDEINALPLFLDACEVAKAVYGNSCIVRPHPVEDKTTFDFEADPLPFVERLRSAKAVVFVSGCGTGIEAALAGVPSVRLGNGGQGLSRYSGVKATDSLITDIHHAEDGRMGTVLDLAYHFAADTVVDHLVDLQQERSATIKADLTQLMFERPPFTPNDFQMNKWPTVPDDIISRLSGCRAIKCGWNLWSLKAS